MKTITSTVNETSLTRLLTYSVWPGLIVIGLGFITMGMSKTMSLPLCNMLFLLTTIVYLAIFERIIPEHPEWNPDLKEWKRDGIYLLITITGGGLSIPVVYALARNLPHYYAGVPLGYEILIGILLSSLGSYVFHRASHVIPWLWKLHGIHHADDRVNVGNNGVNHVLDVFGRRLLAQTPMLMLGLSQEALFVVAIFNTMQGYFVHANVRVAMGWFVYLFPSPAQHRMHHSNKPDEAGHFSVDLTIWDFIFGSFTWQHGKVPAGIGLFKPELFPSADAILDSLLHPFRAWPRPLRSNQAERSQTQLE